MWQLAEEAAQAGKVFGLSVAEWAVLLPLVLTTLASIAKALQKTKHASGAEAKVRAVVDAIEEVGATHPAEIKIVKRIARDKATKFGVQLGVYGLDEDAKRATTRMKKLREEAE